MMKKITYFPYTVITADLSCNAENNDKLKFMFKTHAVWGVEN